MTVLLHEGFNGALDEELDPPHMPEVSPTGFVWSYSGVDGGRLVSDGAGATVAAGTSRRVKGLGTWSAGDSAGYVLTFVAKWVTGPFAAPLEVYLGDNTFLDLLVRLVDSADFVRVEVMGYIGDYYDDRTTSSVPWVLGQSYTIRVEIAPAGISYFLDGELLSGPVPLVGAPFAISYMLLYTSNLSFEDLNLDSDLTSGGPPPEVFHPGYALDMKASGFGLIELGYHAAAAHAPPLTDNLYLVLDEVNEPFEVYMPVASTAPTADPLTIVQFNGDPLNALAYRWRGKLNVFGRAVAMRRVRVHAVDYTNLVLLVYADGELISIDVVTSDEVMTLPVDDTYRTYEIEIVGTSRVQRVLAAEAEDDVVLWEML